MGAVVIAFAVLLLTESVMLFFTAEHLMPGPIRSDRDFLGGVYAVAGLLLLVVGSILEVPARVIPQGPAAAPAPEAQEPAHIEIKRTVMWLAPQAPALSEAPRSLEEQLAEVNRRLASLKVRYGLDELSKEAYKRMSLELERERAELEMALERGDASR